MIAQPGYSPSMMTKTSIQDCLNGHRTAFGWFGTGLAGYPTAPLNRWSQPYRGLSETERQTLEDFFALMNGRFGSFIFLDPAGNLCQYSEDFTNAAWTLGGVAVTSNQTVTDPFNGTQASTLLSSNANGRLATVVLPDGGASGIVLCGSVWLKSSVVMTLRLEFVDSAAAVLATNDSTIPANSWTEVSCPVQLATNNAVSFQIGGNNTWGNGVVLNLFGAQVVPSWGPGGYAKSPVSFGRHDNVRFDQDELSITKTDFNRNDVDVKLTEFFVS